MENKDKKIERLIKANMKPCLVMCKKFIHDEDGAEMLRSHVLEKAWKYRDKFEGTDSNFKAWLYTITRNTYFDVFSKNKKEGVKISIEDSFEHPSVESHEDKLGNENLIRDITYTIDTIFSNRESGVFKMNTYQGFKYEEIAEHFNITLGTVKNIIHRVRLYVSNENNIISPPIEKIEPKIIILPMPNTKNFLQRRIERIQKLIATLFILYPIFK